MKVVFLSLSSIILAILYINVLHLGFKVAEKEAEDLFNAYICTVTKCYEETPEELYSKIMKWGN